MDEFKKYIIGFGIGLIVAIAVLIWQFIKRKVSEKASKKEIQNLKDLLAQRMELESDGLTKLKAENEDLKKQNENLRITNAGLLQKPGRAESQRLQVYQKAVDRLTINSPGFGAAWQSALKDSEDEFSQMFNGTQAFQKKVLPSKTDAKLLDEDNDVIDEQ